MLTKRGKMGMNGYSYKVNKCEPISVTPLSVRPWMGAAKALFRLVVANTRIADRLPQKMTYFFGTFVHCPQFQDLLQKLKTVSGK